MPTQVIKFGGVDLSDIIATWQESIPTRLNAVSVPRRQGALISDEPVLDARTIGITGRIVSTISALDLRNTLDTLNSLFFQLNQPLQLWDDRYINAYKSQFTYSYVPGSAMCAVDFTITFYCPDPFFYGTTTNGITFTLTTGDNPIDITNNLYSKVVILNNPGTQYIFPIITVSAGPSVGLKIVEISVPATSLGWTYASFNNPATKSLPLQVLILPNNSCIFNMSTLTVVNNGIDSLANWAGDFVYLNPGNNTVQLIGTAPATWNFQYGSRYL